MSRSLWYALLSAAMLAGACDTSETEKAEDRVERPQEDSMPTLTSTTVTSRDGTKIAYDKVGRGPAVILVAGALATREAWTPHAQLLASDFTVYSYDRRGRGDSTDTKPYFAKNEVEDIEALIDAAGGTAYVYGQSSGAALALEAAVGLGDKIEKLAIYEAPYDSSEAGVKGLGRIQE
jgi:pimeloyl-ACP methyl ester carboxylesterase